MTFGFGYRPDPPALRSLATSARLLFGASPAAPKSASLEHLEGPIFDQGDSGSCVGHGTSQGVRVSLRSRGGSLAARYDFVPSPDGIYRITRAIERARTWNGQALTLPPLTDGGAMPGDAIAALARFGVRPIGPLAAGRFSDVTAAHVNDEPILSELEADERHLVTGQYRIDEREGADLVRAAISGAGAIEPCAVGIGVFVDTRFQEWDPAKGPIDGAPDVRDPNGGGHWLAMTSYDGNVFRGPNSWGTSWGSSGHYEVTAAWLAAACSDCIVFAIGGGM